MRSFVDKTIFKALKPDTKTNLREKIYSLYNALYDNPYVHKEFTDLFKALGELSYPIKSLFRNEGEIKAFMEGIMMQFCEMENSETSIHKYIPEYQTGRGKQIDSIFITISSKRNHVPFLSEWKYIYESDLDRAQWKNHEKLSTTTRRRTMSNYWNTRKKFHPPTLTHTYIHQL